MRRPLPTERATVRLSRFFFITTTDLQPGAGNLQNNQKYMKKFLLSTRLRLWRVTGISCSSKASRTTVSYLREGWYTIILLLVVLLPIGMKAEKIDDTHYRFCVMDDAVIEDPYAKELFDKGYLNTISPKWSADYGLKIIGDTYRNATNV